MLRLIFLLLLMAGPLQAGPWLREKGAGFLSFSTIQKKAERLTDPLAYMSLYAEYGLRESLTLGLDLGGDDLGKYKAILFALRPIRTLGDQTRLTAEFGLGVVNDNFVLRPGVALGRGFQTFGKPGWLSLEMRAEMTPELKSFELGTDLTLGLSPWERGKVIFQVQSGGTMADPDYLRVAPSFVYEIKPGRHLEIGATAGLKNTEKYGIKLGVWRSF